MRMSRFLPALIVAALITAPTAAHAGVGLGLFLGEPTGITLKADLQRRTSLEVLLGVESLRNGEHGGYGHFTFLVSPFVAHGQSVSIPFRFGIGAAVYDWDGARFGDDLAVAVRAPFEVAFDFHSSPFELYLELALKLTLVDPAEDLYTDLDGGLGFRIYF
jgi:hypothetical protein